MANKIPRVPVREQDPQIRATNFEEVCYGYDLDMTQKEIRYAAIPDLRTKFHPSSEIDCIVKEYHPVLVN